MMKQKSRFLALLMALCLLASLAVLPAAAEETAGDPPTSGDNNPSAPSDPSGDDKPSEPSNPGGDEPSDPSNPGGDKPSDPSNPGGDEPSDPSNPGGDKPSDPSNPGGDKPSDPSNPGGDKPSDPSNPGGDKPSDPSNPGGDKPSDPSNPGGDKPSDPSNPGGDKPSDPSNPGGDKPSDPSNPGGDKPSDPSNPGGTEKPPVVNPPKPTIGAPSNSALICSPSRLSFSLQKGESGSNLNDSVTITNNGDYDMTNLRVSAPSGFSASLSRTSLSQGSSATVNVSVSSTSKTGSYSGKVTVTASYVDGTGSNSYDIYVSATVTEKGYSISVDPTSKDLGKLSEGYSERDAEDKEITIKVTNKGASSVRMHSVKGDDHFYVTAVKDEDITLDYDDSASYKITPKKNLSAGTYTDSIVFQTKEGATATFKAKIVIEKYVDPLTLNVSTLDFGNAETGYAAVNSQTVTVKNNTERTLKLEQPYSYNYDIGTISKDSIPAGGTATFSVRPRTGLSANVYNDAITVRAGNYSASLNLRFTVVPKALMMFFVDVAADNVFSADITYVSQKGLMSGKGNNQFKPQDPVTRGQIVTILYRLEGQPAVSGSGFADVAAGSYCEKAVKWAAAAGITNGNKDGNFQPDNPITREQMATFLYRYNKYKNYNTASKADLSKFSDAGRVSAYAKDALSWANGAGLVNGSSDGKLNPTGGANRGQAAAILHRFCVSIGK